MRLPAPKSILGRSPVLLSALLLAAPAARAQWSTTDLSQGRWRAAAAAADGWAVFAGGLTCPTSGSAACTSALVDALDTRTGAWVTASLSSPRSFLAAASVDGKVFFAGGSADLSPFIPSATVDIWDSAVGAPDDPAAWSVATLSHGRSHLTGAAVGPYVLFAGGGDGVSQSARVDVYDSQSDTWSTASLSVPRCCIAPVTVGSKVIFAGGFSSGAPSDAVDVYDAALGAPSDPNAWSTAQLSTPRNFVAGTAAGQRAMFGGGAVLGPGVSDVVDVYDDATGTWSVEHLSTGRRWINAVTIGSLAFFAGGDRQSSGSEFPVVAPSSDVDVYDAVTGAWSRWSMPAPRTVGASVVVDGVAYFAGGADGGSVQTHVDVLDPRIGLRVCSPAVPNSTGAPATLDVIGASEVSVNDLRLAASGLPPQSFAFFLTSRATGLVVQAGGSQGTLCLGGAIGRFVGPGQVQGTGAGGDVTLPVDLTALPSPTGPVVALAGQSWSFQAWYRDANPTVTSNFTDAVTVDLQ